MTVPVQDPVANHIGNGVTTAFAFGFKLLDEDDLEVSVAGLVKTLGIDYSIAGVGVESGGTVTFTAAPAALAAIALVRQVPINRETDYQYSGEFESDVVNRDFDRIVMMLQDSGLLLANSVRLPPGDATSGVLPSAADRALKGMAFDADGNIFLTAASGNADVLAAALGSSSTALLGGGLVGYDGAKAYAAGTVGDGIKDAAADALAATTNINTFKTDVASLVNATRGAALMGYLPSYTGAVGATLADVLDERVSMKRFGLRTTNTGAQNVTAWNAAIAYAIAQGGMTLYIPRGTYDFNDTISTAGANNLRITGDGPDATILRITHATASFISAIGETYYQTYDNFSLTSTVTRTGGSMMRLGTGALGLWKRGLVHRVRIQRHFNGINLAGFEQSTLSEVFIVRPSGAGASLICGVPAATNQAANLNILNCFGRGNDEVLNDTPLSLYAIILYDIEAIFCVNSDFANYVNQIMVVDPQTRVANCHFLQTYFDGTWNGDNVLIQGAGIKQQFQFTGCWFNGAGNAGPGTNDCMGVNAIGAGEYYDWNFTGCRWLSTKGSAFYTTSRYIDFTFTGCVFTNTGFGGGTYKNAMHFQPSAASLKSPVISGCKFQDSGAKDIRVETNANNVVITGNHLEAGIFVASGTRLGNCSGNFDGTASAAVASASSIVVPHTIDYVVISGTTTINAVQPTFAGHKVAFRTTSALTWADDGGNLRLVGNYVTTGNSVLTLVCEANGDWREVARATS